MPIIVIALHCIDIAMPNGLYFTAVVSFFLSFFRHLISKVTEQISTKLGHMLIYDYYLNNWSEPPGISPTGWGQKPLLGTDFEL